MKKDSSGGQPQRSFPGRVAWVVVVLVILALGTGLGLRNQSASDIPTIVGIRLFAGAIALVISVKLLKLLGVWPK
jgi:hypothetical protein